MESRPKSQNPNTKLQRNPSTKLQNSLSSRRIGAWYLELPWYLDLGVWSLQPGVWSLDLGAFIFGQK
jgi:hypothetical protein